MCQMYIISGHCLVKSTEIYKYSNNFDTFGSPYGRLRKHHSFSYMLQILAVIKFGRFVPKIVVIRRILTV